MWNKTLFIFLLHVTCGLDLVMKIMAELWGDCFKENIPGGPCNMVVSEYLSLLVRKQAFNRQTSSWTVL